MHVEPTWGRCPDGRRDVIPRGGCRNAACVFHNMCRICRLDTDPDVEWLGVEMDVENVSSVELHTEPSFVIGS